jgi:hypothetical protein
VGFVIFLALVFSLVACCLAAAVLQDVKELSKKCDDGYIMCCRLNSRMSLLERKLLERKESQT